MEFNTLKTKQKYTNCISKSNSAARIFVIFHHITCHKFRFDQIRFIFSVKKVGVDDPLAVNEKMFDWF